MSKPKGNFTCADLMQVQVQIDKIWADAPANRIQFIANVDAFNALRSKQTTTIQELQDPKKKRSVKVYWLSDCEPDAPINTDDRCVAGGNEISSDCVEYEMTQFAKRGLTVREYEFEQSNYDYTTVAAFGLMRRMKQLDEAIGLAVLALLETFKGKNKYTGGVGTVSGTTTSIRATAWDANLMGYFYKTMKLNRFSSAFLLSGNNLFDQAWQIQMQADNLQNGKGDVNKMKAMEIINDLFQMETALPGSTYMVSPGAYSFVSRAVNPSTPREITNGANMTLFSIASKNIPGLVYDVTYKTRCVNNEIYHDWGITAHWDFLQNPLDCDLDYTGVLEFLCAA